jgi:dienelactone hydrolase
VGDPEYAAQFWNAEPAFDRSPRNGLRCVKYFSEPSRRLTRRITHSAPAYAELTPMSDTEFRIATRVFDYDATSLHASVTEVESNDRWTQQLVTFDAAYGGEQMQARLFVPTKGTPPFQTVVFYPGDYAYYPNKFERHPFSLEVTNGIVDSGRMLVWPIYKGTFERKERPRPNRSSNAWRNMFVQQVQDLRRTIDYLEERADVAVDRIAYLGISNGGSFGPVFLAVERRIDVGILNHGGLHFKGVAPEIDPFNYASRVLQPILMVNGRYDSLFLPGACQIPLYKLLPSEDKTYQIVNSGHVVPADIQRREILMWLDHRFGSPRDSDLRMQDPEIRRQVALARSIHSIGSVLMDVGDMRGARDSLHAADELFESLMASNPDNIRQYETEITFVRAKRAAVERSLSLDTDEARSSQNVME